MIYITGDTHGDFKRFNDKNFPVMKELTKNDYVIVTGDFGYWSEDDENVEAIDRVDGLPFTTLFVEGNHSNYDMLKELPVEQWHGGDVQFIRPSVIHLMRGRVYDIDGKKFFTFGGASSHDIDDGILEGDDPNLTRKLQIMRKLGHNRFRINHLSWWKEELPSAMELAEAVAKLDSVDWKVDYIITHCAANSIQAILSSGEYLTDILTDFFEQVATKCKFEAWFFGHYHTDVLVEKKFRAMYTDIIQLDAYTEDIDV